MKRLLGMVLGALVVLTVAGCQGSSPAPQTAETVGEQPPENRSDGTDLVGSPADWSFRAPSVTLGSRRLVVNGPAPSRYSYLMVSKPRAFGEGAYIVADGTLTSGGLSLGIQQDDKWVKQFTNDRPGPFRISLQVPLAGSFQVVLANAVEKDGDANRVELSSLVVMP